jgi:hypothetical protein
MMDRHGHERATINAIFGADTYRQQYHSLLFITVLEYIYYLSYTVLARRSFVIITIFVQVEQPLESRVNPETWTFGNVGPYFPGNLSTKRKSVRFRIRT